MRTVNETRAIMWIKTPDSIQQILIECPLEPEADDALEVSLRAQGGQGIPLDIREVRRSMPIVAIGQPETWSLKDLYQPKQIPHSLRAKATEADFYLIRFSCSFRPFSKEIRIEWARFCISLLPHTVTKEQPITYDLYPQNIIEEVKRQTKVTLNPQLKFQELEVSGGSAEFAIDYAELHPMISAAIMDSYTPSWDYTEAPGYEIQGTKWMYLFIKAPKGLLAGYARLDLLADVVMQGKRFPAVLWPKKNQVEEMLTVQLWGPR